MTATEADSQVGEQKKREREGERETPDPIDTSPLHVSSIPLKAFIRQDEDERKSFTHLNSFHLALAHTLTLSHTCLYVPVEYSQMDYYQSTDYVTKACFTLQVQTPTVRPCGGVFISPVFSSNS